MIVFRDFLDVDTPAGTKPVRGIVIYKTLCMNYNENYLPIDFYSLIESNQDGVKWFQLQLNYYYGDNITLNKRFEPVCVAEYKEHAPDKGEINRQIILNDWNRWNTSLNKIDVIEISEAVYYNLLEALPPRNWKGNYFEVGEPYNHENGKPIHRACIKIDDKFYTGHPETITAKFLIKNNTLCTKQAS